MLHNMTVLVHKSFLNTSWFGKVFGAARGKKYCFTEQIMSLSLNRKSVVTLSS